ncbi:hypothetical protein LINGRAHAP2_LOCUS13076 [Linum grandiflorum]
MWRTRIPKMLRQIRVRRMMILMTMRTFYVRRLLSRRRRKPPSDANGGLLWLSRDLDEESLIYPLLSALITSGQGTWTFKSPKDY